MDNLIKLKFNAKPNYRQHLDGDFKGDGVWRDGDVRDVDVKIAKGLLRDYPLVFSTVKSAPPPKPKPMSRQPNKEVTTNKPKDQRIK